MTTVRVTLYRCKAEKVEPGLAAADGRCKNWTFGPDWRCPFHAEAGVEPFVMVSVDDVERILGETSRYFAGDHLNAGVVVGEVRKRVRARR